MTAPAHERPAEAAYERLRERILLRDQRGASDVFYSLVREGRGLRELLRETVRIHAPYTHVPYHQRIDNGVVRFVNNDHCLLSARTSLKLSGIVGPGYEFLPMAQTVWYVPTGLDVWNQLRGRMPGHYSRNRGQPVGEGVFPPPEIHIAEQEEPERLDGSLEERLGAWLTLVERGEVERAYRVFLGLLENPAERERALAELAFAGLIDVQDRMLFNRSYTTGHKAYRARATIELGEAVGWDEARPVIYAGVPDIAVGPRWYSAYEMAGEVAWLQLAEEEERHRSSLDPSPDLPPERRLLANEEPLSAAESAMLIQALIRQPEPAYIEAISSLLLGGRDPRRIADVLQVAAAQVVLETADPRSYSMPQHAYEYTNTLGWFYDRFDHPHRIKLLYVAGSFINQCARWLDQVGRNVIPVRPPREIRELGRDALLRRLDEALVGRATEESVACTAAYLAGGYAREPLVRTLALAAAKHGNDPHNQELGLCFLEDYGKTAARERDTLLLAGAAHTAGHIKYGDSLEAYRRFADAFGMPSRQRSEGDADPAEAVLDA
jgi:hypothetical protein